MIKDNQWVFTFKEDFETELDKVIKQAEKEFGVTPEVKLDYKLQLTIRVSGAGIGYPHNINLNSKNITKARKAHLVAKNILRSIKDKQFRLKKIPHINSRIYAAKALAQGKAVPTWYIPYGEKDDPVWKANAVAPPTVLETYLHPALSNQLKKEIVKIK